MVLHRCILSKDWLVCGGQAIKAGDLVYGGLGCKVTDMASITDQAVPSVTSMGEGSYMDRSVKMWLNVQRCTTTKNKVGGGETTVRGAPTPLEHPFLILLGGRKYLVTSVCGSLGSPNAVGVAKLQGQGGGGGGSCALGPVE